MSVKGAAVKRLFLFIKNIFLFFTAKKNHCLRYLSEAAV